MKKIDMFCASQASTFICMSMDHHQASSSTIHLGSSRFIDRHNPIITDSRRIVNTPCSFQSPIDPKPQKNQNNFTKSKDYLVLNKKSSKQSDQNNGKKKKKTIGSVKEIDTVKKTSVKNGDLINPLGSSRYLLGSSSFFDVVSDSSSVMGLAPIEAKNCQVLKFDESSSSCSKPFSSSRSSDQVVVLRVSLHCKGCEGKVRKHISRMPGVKSFNIDFAAKKVTVVGDVTPLSVLASISKVKNAQLLATPAANNKL